MKNLPLYLLGMLLCIYIMVMYTEPAFFIVVLVMAVILILDLLLAIYLRSSLEISGEMSGNFIHHSEVIPITIHIHNKSFLPVSHLRIRISYSNKMGGISRKQWICTYADARAHARVTVNLASECCGVLRIHMEKFRAAGPFKLFAFSVKVGHTLEIPVFPYIFPVNFEISTKIRDFIGESDTYSKSKSGDDPSEVFDVRSFRQGDRISRIHWKLTARADEIMVKEFSRPVGYPVVLFFNFSQPSREGLSKAQVRRQEAEILRAMTDVIEAGLSMSAGLARAQCWHYIAWCREDMTIERHAIESEEDVYEHMGRLLYAHPHIKISDPRAFYSRTWGADSFCTFLSVNTNMTIEKDGEIYEERGLDRDTLSGENFIL